MLENEKPKLSAELLHQLLGEYVEKADQALRRHAQIRARLLGSATVFGLLAFFILWSVTSGDRWPIWVPFGIITLAISAWMLTLRTEGIVAKEDLSLSVWQLRRIYELASRYEDTGPELEPALRTGIVLKLGAAQLLLRQLEKFERKDDRFAEMRSLGPDPLKIQAQGQRVQESVGSVSPGLAATER